MRREIEDKTRPLDVLRRLTARNLRALEAWYDVELTYTSNAIEGNTLTRAETAIVLENGLTISGEPLKDHLEGQVTPGWQRPPSMPTPSERMGR